jgi:hypothetical protein
LTCDYVNVYSRFSANPFHIEAKWQNGKAAQAAAPVHPFNPSSSTTSTRFLGSWDPPPKISTCDLGMSTTGQTASPSRTDNFKAIFQTASREYERVTGKLLDTHPFSKQLDGCDSPEAVSNVLRTQAQAFSKFRKGDEKLMAWLDPTVNILFTFSATLGEGIGLVSHRILPMLSSDVPFSAILARENNIYWYQPSSRSMHPKSPVVHMFNTRTHRQQGMSWQTTIRSSASLSASTSSFNV